MEIKRSYIKIFECIAVLLIIFACDGRQQYRFMVGSEAYRNMGEENYSEALNLFRIYLNNAPEENSLYWIIFSLVSSSNDEFHPDRIKKAMDLCESRIIAK